MKSDTTHRPTPVIRKEIAQATAAIDNTNKPLMEQMRKRSKLYDELDKAMEEKYG